MSNTNNRFSRRKFLQSSALSAVAAASGTLTAPTVLRAQGGAVKIGFLQPVSGALSIVPLRPAVVGQVTEFRVDGVALTGNAFDPDTVRVDAALAGATTTLITQSGRSRPCMIGSTTCRMAKAAMP